MGWWDYEKRVFARARKEAWSLVGGSVRLVVLAACWILLGALAHLAKARKAAPVLAELDVWILYTALPALVTFVVVLVFQLARGPYLLWREQRAEIVSLEDRLDLPEVTVVGRPGLSLCVQDSGLTYLVVPRFAIYNGSENPISVTIRLVQQVTKTFRFSVQSEAMDLGTWAGSKFLRESVLKSPVNLPPKSSSERGYLAFALGFHPFSVLREMHPREGKLKQRPVSVELAEAGGLTRVLCSREIGVDFDTVEEPLSLQGEQPREAGGAPSERELTGWKERAELLEARLAESPSWTTDGLRTDDTLGGPAPLSTSRDVTLLSITCEKTLQPTEIRLRVDGDYEDVRGWLRAIPERTSGPTQQVFANFKDEDFEREGGWLYLRFSMPAFSTDRMLQVAFYSTGEPIRFETCERSTRPQAPRTGESQPE